MCRSCWLSRRIFSALSSPSLPRPGPCLPSRGTLVGYGAYHKFIGASLKESYLATADQSAFYKVLFKFLADGPQPPSPPKPDYQSEEPCASQSTSSQSPEQPSGPANKKKACEICGKYFLPTSLLQHKYQKHPNNNKTECRLCGKRIFKFQLQAHLVKRHGVRPQCKICGKHLHPGSLKRHIINQHSRQNVGTAAPFQCLICAKEVPPHELAQHNIEAHRDIAEEDRDLLRVGCGICNKVMAPTDLAGHKAKHQEEQGLATGSKEGKIPCEICGRSFLPASLKKHILWMHSSKEELRRLKVNCQFCGLLLKPCNLKNHIRSFHKQQFSALYPADADEDSEGSLLLPKQVDTSSCSMGETTPAEVRTLRIRLFQ